MSFAAKHNRGGKFTFKAPEGFEYLKLEQLDKKKVYPVKALFIGTKGKYGESSVIVTEECFVNLPKNMNGEVRRIINDDDDVADINAGKVGFVVREYTLEEYPGKTFYNVEFVDIN